MDNRSRFKITLAALLLLAMACPPFAIGQLATEGFALPEPGREWRFPRDHANHGEYAVEWWYYTGHLIPVGEDPDDPENWIHIQLTFFRNELPGDGSGRLYFAHLATSGPGLPFHYAERTARGTLGEAGSEEPVFHVWIDDWRASLLDEERHLLEAWHEKTGGFRLIATPTLGTVLNGEEGFSPKGPGGTEASHYSSTPRMATTGWWYPPENGDRELASPTLVKGEFWQDHEFGNQSLGEGLVGWDWWGLHLPGGGALMFYRIRRESGEAIPQSEGTLVHRDGSCERVRLNEITIETLDHWTSSASGARYPHGWRMELPEHGLELEVQPVRRDQELRTDQSTRVTYYEGAVIVRDISTEQWDFGYVELVGY